MEQKRAYIIGSKKGICYDIKEFIDKKDVITKIIFDYNEGLERLFFENPDLCIIEFTSDTLSPSFLIKIENSDKLQLIKDYNINIDPSLVPVLLLDDTDGIYRLLDVVETFLNKLKTRGDAAINLNFPYSGSLDEVFLPKVFMSIEQAEKTGVLHLTSESKLKVYFHQGYPIFAEGGNLETGLGQILLKNGKITNEQYNEAVEQAQSKNIKIGEYFASMKLISPHELNTYLELQAKEKIIRGFLYTKGNYQFEETENFPVDMFYSKLNTPEVIQEALQKYLDLSKIEISSSDLKISNKLNKSVRDLGLGPKQLRAVQLLSKNNTLEEVVKTANLSPEELKILLFFLAMYNLIEIKNISVDEIGTSSFELASSEFEEPDESATAEMVDSEVIVLVDEVDEMDNVITESQVEQGDDVAVAAHTFQNEYLGDQDPISINAEETTEEVIINNENEFNSETEFVKIDQQVTSTIEDGLETEKVQITDDLPTESSSQEEQTVNGDRGKSIEIEINEFYDSISSEEDYYKILDVDPDANTDAIKEVYFKLVKRFHPDANQDVPEEIRNKAEEIFTKVTRAYETLSDDEKRTIYDSKDELEIIRGKAKSIYEAEMLYKEGEILLRQRNYNEAMSKLANAVELNPEESEYVGAYSWAKFISSDDKSGVLNDAVREIENAISMNSHIAKNFFYLGMIYKFSDNNPKAETSFSKAVEIDPNLIEAKRELRLLKSRKMDRKKVKDKGIEKRFWSSLFKK